MAYTLEDLRKLRGGPGNFRKLELKAGEPRKIWIPKLLVTYHRVHNKIKQHTSFKSAKGDFKDCLNQTFGERGKGCPICDQEVRALWDSWKAAKEAGAAEAELKKITKMINELTAEEYFINAIDVKDIDRKYVGCRFTPAAFKTLEQIDVKYGIENVILIYSKTENPTRYAITAEDDRPELVSELKANLEIYDGREEVDGGMIDLDKHLIRTYTLADYNSWLTSGEVSEDEHVAEPPPVETKKKTTTTFTKPAETKVETKKVETTTTVVQSSDVIPLDDLDVPPPPPAKVETAPVTSTTANDTLDLPGLDGVPDLDKLDLDNMQTEAFVKIDAKMINDRRNEREFILRLYEFLIQEKRIEPSTDYKQQLVNCHAYVKSKNGIEVPESVAK